MSPVGALAGEHCRGDTAPLRIKCSGSRIISGVERDTPVVVAQLSALCITPSDSSCTPSHVGGTRSSGQRAAPTQDEVRAPRPAYQSEFVPPADQFRRALLRRSACSGCSACLLPTCTPFARGASGGTVSSHRRLGRRLTAPGSQALLRGAGRAADLAGPVPLCFSGGRGTASRLGFRDPTHTPVEWRSSGGMGGSTAECCNVPGPPTPAGPGRGMVHPTQPANPGPRHVDLQSVSESHY